MKKSWVLSLDLFFIGPPLILAIVVSLWVVISAAYENFRLATATDQIIQVVSIAREMKFTPNYPKERSLYELIQRLATLSPPVKVVELPDASAVGGHAYGFKNPWQDHVFLSLVPAEREIRLTMPVSASACRRLLAFYQNDAGALGVSRVTALDQEEEGAVERLIYQGVSGDKSKKIEADMIYGGCGESGRLSVFMAFFL